MTHNPNFFVGFINIDIKLSDCQVHGAMADASLPLGEVAEKGTVNAYVSVYTYAFCIFLGMCSCS